MDKNEEQRLVREALMNPAAHCLDWVNDDIERRVSNDPEVNRYMSVRQVKKLLIAHVQSGGEIRQHVEDREFWRDKRDYWYHSILKVDGLLRGMFVEYALTDPDLPVMECLTVSILNVHPEWG